MIFYMDQKLQGIQFNPPHGTHTGKNNSKELKSIAVESRKLICGHCHANTVTSVVTFFCCFMCTRGDQKVLQLATLVNSASVL